MSIEFQEFPKIPRYRREVALTEKLDGTNSAVVWSPVTRDHHGDIEPQPDVMAIRDLVDQHGIGLGPYYLLAQSRQRFITPNHIKPKNDNYGFAEWVYRHADELTKLGPGYHYGEWWGYGIQRGYGLPEKRFSLFNVGRWGEGRQERPACCHVVPLLAYTTPDKIQYYVDLLAIQGSFAAPGYQRPEGLVIWHSQSKQHYKIMIDGDDVPKSVKEKTYA